MFLFGMKLLTLLGSIGAGLTAWLASSITRKAVVVFSVIVAFVSVVVAFLACMKILVTAVTALIVMPVWLESVIGMFIPSNYAGVISLIFSAKTCRAAYELAKEKVKLIGQSS